MRDRAGAPNIAAEFVRIALANENPAIAHGVTFADFARRAVVIADFINCVQSVDNPPENAEWRSAFRAKVPDNAATEALRPGLLPADASCQRNQEVTTDK